MPLAKTHDFAFGGLNTKTQSTGLPLLEMTTLQDMRVVGTNLVERLGIYRLAQFAGNNSAMDFDGTNEYVAAAIDTRPWTLGLYWTLELALEPDTTAGTQGILAVGSTTPALVIDIASTNIRFRIWDSASTLTTITVGAAAASVQTIQITRSAATLTTRLNNGTAVTGSMSATLNVIAPVGELRIGRDDSTNYYNGTVDYVRLMSYVKANHNDRLIRAPNPRAPHFLADYDFNESAGGLVYDRSRYENHLVTYNTPTEVTTLCHNPAPIRAISQSVDQNNRKQLLVVAGGKYYLCGVD